MNPLGFLTYPRINAPKQDPQERIAHSQEFETLHPLPILHQQAERCMSCGTPFCMAGCPLGNFIPDWNQLVYQSTTDGEYAWREALDQLHATNNFPEFTGRTCPAPCENACVLAINDSSVTIKSIENTIIEHGWEKGWIHPHKPTVSTGKRVAVVGSGPAGLACAQQLIRVGHAVTVFEKDDRIGGLLRYGIPNFKMDRHVIDRRIQQLREEGIMFRTGVCVGRDYAVQELHKHYDAIVLTVGAPQARNIVAEGRELHGIHFAMEYLTEQNRRDCGDTVKGIDVRNKHVVIIGGGDTGSDCLGTALRHGARSVTQMTHSKLPDVPHPSRPWPHVPVMLTLTTSQEEGGAQEYCMVVKRFIGGKGKHSGSVSAIECAHVDVQYTSAGHRVFVEREGENRIVPADIVLLAVGFTGVEYSLAHQLGCTLNAHGTFEINAEGMTTRDGVFATGDAVRGASLVVWAIADGRSIARSVDEYLMGSSSLPDPLRQGHIIGSKETVCA
jgi:glutamate synthase (NADPH/NADH) small chain